jgi:hypothetical protein
MTLFVGEAKEVLDTAEVVTIGTCGEEGIHLVATWGDYVRKLGIQDGDVILMPAGGYRKTEQNLRKNPGVEVLMASKAAGTGFRLSGRAKVHVSGPWADKVQREFSWARGALAIHVEQVQKLL